MRIGFDIWYSKKINYFLDYSPETVAVFVGLFVSINTSNPVERMERISVITVIIRRALRIYEKIIVVK